MGPALPEPGQTFAGRYRIEETLGRGGMAVVYRATDVQHGRDVALKVLFPQVGALLGSERFLREIATTARLAHPNILPLFDSGSEHGLDWYAMPYLPGRTLRDRLAAGQLGLPEAMRIFADIASALDHAHRQGLVHRDVKPANILLQEDRATLADFGIALPLGAGGERLTETGFSLGTPDYMSPEQAAAERDIDARSDQYALACVLYEMVAGEPPFTGPNAQAVLAKRLLEPVPRLSTLREVSAALEAAITRALARNPIDRFPSVAAFAAAVEGSVGTRPSSQARWLRPGLAVAVELVVAAAVVLRFWWSSHQPRLDPKLVVVLPFRVNAPGANLAAWEDGVVDLLGAKLTGEGGPRAADPRTTLAVYHSLIAGGASDLSRQLAIRLGAGQVLDGGIVGDARHILVTASLTIMPVGQRGSPASVEGPPDSIVPLIDRLMIVLLGRQAGEAEPSLGTLTTLPAWQAYLEGRRAFREGRADDAIAAYRRALEADSTFVLPALDLIPALRRQAMDDPRVQRLLVSSLPRLSRTDSLRFYVIMGPHYPLSDNVLDRLRIREQLVARLPERADAWFELGDEQFHSGPLADLDSASLRARQSLSRALALDSSNAIVIVHLLLIAFEDGDTTSMQALFRLHQAHDSLGVAEPFVRWRVALARGDSATVRQVRANLSEAPDISLGWMSDLPQGDGLGVDDAIRAVEAARNRAATPDEREAAAALQTKLYLNLGRPSLVPPKHEAGDAIAEALFGEGDSMPALTATRAVRSAALRKSDTGYQEWVDLLMLGFWELAHGQVDKVRQLPAQLRVPLLPRRHWSREIADDSLLGPRLLEAWIAVEDGRPGARTLLLSLDSLVATGPATGLGPILPLTLGRLFEELGDHERAWHALGRVPWMSWLQPNGYNSTVLLARARAGSRAGHRDAAIHDYRVYLALRQHPDPGLVPERDSARAELERLVATRQ